jgi:hypothetical protein
MGTPRQGRDAACARNVFSAKIQEPDRPSDLFHDALIDESTDLGDASRVVADDAPCLVSERAVGGS